MSSWDLSQLFYNDLGTGNWLTSFQFSRRARRKTLVSTDLSISLQGLAKLWRVLLWESLTNTWKTAQSRVTANTCLQGKVLFNKLMAFYGKVTHSADRRELGSHHHSGFPQSFQYGFSQYSPGENVWHAAGWVNDIMSEQSVVASRCTVFVTSCVKAEVSQCGSFGRIFLTISVSWLIPNFCLQCE